MKRSYVFPSFAVALMLFLFTSLAPAAHAAGAVHLTFVTHAAFFSQETHQTKPIDPQVFVRETASPAATGPQGIHHVAGVRPALIDQDPKDSLLFTAGGKPLGFKLGQWLAAEGKVTITPKSDGTARVTASFSKLRPGGHYSLFENHFDQKPIGFTPLDGAGTSNNFIADKDGNARIGLVAPKPLTHANAVLLVYHSDRKSHGKQRGQIGVNAHHQLIARIPG